MAARGRAVRTSPRCAAETPCDGRSRHDGGYPQSGGTMSIIGPPAEVKLAGELDISRKQELREALSSAANGKAVLLDLSGVTWADSTALAELLRFCTDLERRRIPVALVVVAPQFN